MKKLGHLLAVVALFSVASPTALAQDFDAVEIQSEQVSGNIWVLYGSGGNIGVSVGEDGVFIVDDQFAPLSDKIRAAIGEISDKSVRFVINTHWHFDHVEGNENFAGSGAVIIAHDNVYTRLTSDQIIADLPELEFPPSPSGALPVITFSAEASFHLNGEEARIIHVANAHTDGDSMVHFKESNVIHMGDMLNGSFPFIDYSSGGSIGGLIKAAEAALALGDADTRYIPGHGRLMGRADLENYRAMLTAVRERVAAMVAAGKSMDEIIAALPVDGYEAPWTRGANGAERFVKNIVLTLDGPVEN